MSQYDKDFWNGSLSDKYGEIVEAYEQNIEITHPHSTNCVATNFIHHCSFCATNTDYYEYRGSNLF